MIQTSQPSIRAVAEMGDWTAILQQYGLSTLIAVALLYVFVTLFRKQYARLGELEDRQFKMANDVIAKNTSALDRVADALERMK